MKKLLLLILFSVFAFSCKIKNSYSFEETKLVPLYEAQEDSIALEKPTQLWHKSFDCICVLFGYGYNDEEFVSEAKEKFSAQYGNYSEGGKFFPLVFPDDFKRGSRTYISELTTYLSDKEVSVLVLLGAPERTHNAIARLQDSFDGKLPYPVISLFSQDEVIAMEDSADFLLDKIQKAQIDGLVTTETEQNFIQEVPEILERAIFLGDLSESPFEKKSALIDIVKSIAQNKKVSRYIDGQTNLPSINHFVME